MLPYLLFDCHMQREGPVREWDLAKIGERSPGERERERERLRREREEERLRERHKSRSPTEGVLLID